MKGFKILRVFMIIALLILTGYSIYAGINAVKEDRTISAAIDFVYAGIDMTCWVYWAFIFNL